MAKRHVARPGDWDSLSLRLDEIISAASGEDPFLEALKLLLGKIVSEEDAVGKPFLRRHPQGPAAELDGLLQRAACRWPGVLGSDRHTRLRDAELARCADLLQGEQLRSADLIALDAIFEHMVSRAAKGQKGQFFTPRHVVAEVVRMMQPQPHDWVVDPACGSAGFLRHALRQAPSCSVHGFDIDPRATQVARVMMAASGGRPACIQRADSLRRQASPDSPDLPSIEALMTDQHPGFAGFDLVLTNPPFAGDVGREYGQHYSLAQGRRVERDVLFVERCVGLLKPGGRLAMVLPHNKVGGEHWTYLRRWLLQQVRVVAVLSLGRNTFLPHTSQKACVVIGCRRPQPCEPSGDEEVLFYISERDGKDERGRSIYLPRSRELHCDLPDVTPAVQRALLLAQGGSAMAATQA